MDVDPDRLRQERSEHAVTRITAAQLPLYAYIRGLVLSPDDAEDVLQEVNLVLWRKIGEFDGRGPFLTWACHIAYLQYLAFSKRQKRDNHAALDEAVLSDVAKSMAEKVGRLDVRIESLDRCLGKLAPRHRQMILRRYDVGGSVGAIAAELGRPAASVRVSLHRIRQALIECVSQTIAAGETA